MEGQESKSALNLHIFWNYTQSVPSVWNSLFNQPEFVSDLFLIQPNVFLLCIKDLIIFGVMQQIDSKWK